MDVDGRVKARDDLLNASADAAAEARPFTLALYPCGRVAFERRRATATEEKQPCAKLAQRRAESREELLPSREVGESSPSRLTVALRRGTAGAGGTSSGGTFPVVVRVPSASPASVPPCVLRAAPCTVPPSAPPSRSCLAAPLLGGAMAQAVARVAEEAPTTTSSSSLSFALESAPASASTSSQLSSSASAAATRVC